MNSTEQVAAWQRLLSEHSLQPLNGATGSVICACADFQYDFAGGWHESLLSYEPMLAEHRAHIAAVAEGRAA